MDRRGSRHSSSATCRQSRRCGAPCIDVNDAEAQRLAFAAGARHSHAARISIWPRARNQSLTLAREAPALARDAAGGCGCQNSTESIRSAGGIRVAHKFLHARWNGHGEELGPRRASNRSLPSASSHSSSCFATSSHRCSHLDRHANGGQQLSYLTSLGILYNCAKGQRPGGLGLHTKGRVVGVVARAANSWSSGSSVA